MAAGFTQDDLASSYQSVLGRAPTQQEISSFMPYANTGSVNLTPMNIQQILQSTPEYQQKNLMSQGNMFQNTMGQSDQRILGMANGQAIQSIAQSGRDVGSSGYVNAFANAAANLATQRQQSLANFYGQGFQSINQNATGQGNAQQQYGQGQQSSTLGYQRQLNMANTQMGYLNQQNQNNQQRGMMGAIGGLAGAGIGAYAGSFMGPGGAQMGMQAGAGIGSSFGQYSQKPPSFGGY